MTLGKDVKQLTGAHWNTPSFQPQTPIFNRCLCTISMLSKGVHMERKRTHFSRLWRENPFSRDRHPNTCIAGQTATGVRIAGISHRSILKNMPIFCIAGQHRWIFAEGFLAFPAISDQANGLCIACEKLFRIASDLGMCDSNRIAYRGCIARFGPLSYAQTIAEPNCTGSKIECDSFACSWN